MQKNNVNKPVKSLTNSPKDTKIEVDGALAKGHDGLSVNLDNTNSALPIMQAPFEFTTPNGCHVKLEFRKESNPRVREEIARLLLDAFEQKVRQT